MDKLNRAAQLVREQLTKAREIAWDAFECPSEETVMAVFHRLCVESDVEPVESPQEMAGVTVH